jgi:hypothetical protein
MPAQFKPPASTFFTAIEREKLMKEKTPLLIVNATEDKDGKFGDGFTYTLAQTDPKTGETKSGFITIKYNARRLEEFEWVCAQLLENPDGIGPIRLDQVPTDKGNPAWVFVGIE